MIIRILIPNNGYIARMHVLINPALDILKAEDIDTGKQVSIRATKMILPPTVALKATEMILPPPVAPTATKLILPPGVMHH